MEASTKRIYKTTLKLSLPIMGQEILNSSVNLADAIMIGRLGNDSINAVGAGNEIVFLFILVTFGIVSGSSAFMGQFWGKGDMKNFHRTMGLCICFAFLGAIIFFGISHLFPERFLRLYLQKESEEVVKLSVDFIKIVSLTFFVNIFTATINGALKSTGQTRLPMATTAAALVANVTLNYIFIFVLDMGVKGAAIATLLARVTELCAQVILINILKMPVRARIGDYFSFNPGFIREFLKVVSPVIGNESIWAFGVTIYKMAYSNLGSDAFSAIQITNPITQIFMVFGQGIGVATGILVANSLGAGERDRAIEYATKSSRLAIYLSLLMALMLVILSPFIINYYEVSDLSKEYGQKILYIVAFMMAIRTYNFVAIVGILRNGGDTLFGLIVDALSVWLVGVPLSLFGSYILNLPVYWVFALASCEELSKFAVCLKRVKSNKWANVLTDKV